jgi:hypothetical protein
VEDAGGQHRVGPGVHRRREVRNGARATAGDQGQAHLSPDGRDELQVEAVPGSVSIHRVEQDLPRTKLGGPCAPRDCVQPCPLPTTVCGHLELARDRAGFVAPTPDISGKDQNLGAEAIRDLGDQIRPGDRRGVDPHLVCPSAQQTVHVVHGPHAPTDGQRDEHLLGGPAHHVKGGLAIAAAGRDIEEGQLVGTLLVVSLCQLDGITRIAQVLEVDPLDDSAGVHIKAGDDPYRDTHPASVPSAHCRPAAVYSPDMDTKALNEAIAQALTVIDETQPRCGETKVVAVDGPSGAGKTYFTAALTEQLPKAHVLHMDDMYPGWDGLDQGIADLHDHVLSPIARGERAAYRGWDWELERYAEWRSLPTTRLLLVDGVGSGAQRNAGLESVLIWLEADPDVRFRRSIERDGESYRPQWQRWAAQEEALFLADAARGRADLIINTTP